CFWGKTGCDAGSKPLHSLDSVKMQQRKSLFPPGCRFVCVQVLQRFKTMMANKSLTITDISMIARLFHKELIDLKSIQLL
ncbi:hypothetical protein, partial [Butyricicoccus sp.]|uniref:hypothetical protein n=1 Tax=Butyricicoccus sp. TaxID=2049021 RepID=UPI003F14FB30